MAFGGSPRMALRPPKRYSTLNRANRRWSLSSIEPQAGTAAPRDRRLARHVDPDSSLPAKTRAGTSSESLHGRRPAFSFYKRFQNPPEIVSDKGVLNANLAVKYTDPSTTSLGGCPLTLRTYNGQLVGPTLRIRQGDTINLTLDNQLPKETPGEIQEQFEQENKSAYLSTTPTSFNTTNLHYHGMHVSPVGNSDNVLLAIAPQSKFAYEVKVPANHPVGSYWYHAHAHGSTSIQVGSGMAGTIIVEDNPATTPKALLAANAREKIFVLQTLLYDEKGRLAKIAALFPGPSKPTPTQCDKASGNEGTWPCSKRRITINGQIVPIITMKRGEVQRWRLVGAAFRESIHFRVKGHDLHEIALDGNYLGHIDTWKDGTAIDVEPGYRSDVLIKAGMQAGDYPIIDAATPAVQSLRFIEEPENVLAILRVSNEVDDMALPTNAEMAALAPFGDLDLSKSAVGVQEVMYKLGQGVQNPDRNYFQVNYRAFSPGNVRQLALNATDMWSISTIGDPSVIPNGIPPLPHVFHIHVNPFQWSRLGPDGKAERVWKDTLLVQGPAVTNVYTRYTDYTDYIGQFVMHCHILDHEDLGMMEVEEVVDTASATAHRHHH
jgi:FtsP/CotA-like multicopper oxidase with cupredoxin domain